ncbi:hypothetical protein FZEAL_3075 [Fusarium zealandicum]|uniref:Uncharacterized protein n=1 Tax=Fusarium zealandicum TaxID=1053134 RepID=A0A8H4UQA7_9HYPO|nr:hypothetical protein FZEAL_3075 [Fusarium zealandicum]
MVKPITLTLVFASLLPSLTSAAACTDGLDYCGYNLIKRGAYKSEIVAELERVGEPVDDSHIFYSYFRCGVGGHGWIQYLGYCERGCYDGGSGENDYC